METPNEPGNQADKRLHQETDVAQSDAERRDFYRNHIHALVAAIEMPKERRIAATLADIVDKKADGVPFIGVAGIPAAGKSTLCNNVQELLREEHGIEALVVGMDGYHYYRSQLDQMDDPEEAHARRGAAFTFDAQRFVDDISGAASSGQGSFPSFDHAVKDPEEDKIKFDDKQH